ncbi:MULTISPECIES: hypothetical protein [unclassified Microcystis]|jgi:hypothetical protein|uniref:hypothetical protein n=2 Tax=unclassified Microcystis TaxID=2643300 RepID=UPI00257EE5E7|nr:MULTISPECIES: hypothetical protein [unclassified Microcystis]MCA2548342.1 hypothetical protein [Microcystis sp. M53BS1]MCA2604917.1 hypothetical protein [Microcystis sp. M26BS1]NCR76463.1 hypothetical protein [Microcystis aeruginosa K13-06]MCA2521449.1 hypothetical protein [Microcystis sp. M63BS1]MCA2530506.1 hypothetical protein [Microcystis sp. M51BS1]
MLTSAEHRMNASELARSLVQAWVQNDVPNFLSLFAARAQIVHPYFQEAIIPSVALEVINATVKPTTVLKEIEILFGNGDGNNDVIKLVCQENEIGNEPKYDYLSEIIVTAKIHEHKFTELLIHGFNVSENREPLQRKTYERRNLERLTAREIAEQLVRSWSRNNMEAFLSVFSPVARIKHPGIENEVTPEVIADVMNSDVSVSTELKSFSLLQGDGSGRSDQVEMQFYEWNKNEKNFSRPTGVMSVTATIENHQIVYLFVRGYQVPEAGIEQDKLSRSG